MKKKSMFFITMIIGIIGLFLYLYRNDLSLFMSEDIILEPMEMSEREEGIVDALKGNYTLAYDISSRKLDRYTVELWIERYLDGEKLEEFLHKSSFKPESSVVSILFDELTIDQNEEQQSDTILKASFIDNEQHDHTQYVYHENDQSIFATIFSMLEEETEIELNKENVIALKKLTSSEKPIGSITIEGLTEKDLENIVRTSEWLYIYKIKVVDGKVGSE
ncbi:hypothetical protein LC087_09720 [Bacillus carboniphilus]|uniref:Bypass of forespore C C-terminal domain-containing protein n=1 Tax=Bacillus carboniphilus TaxID=86663 RepID=A0ABY9JU63_9BACI|nr:hypothetical protein [Bacillus carboniphilus]WLR41221.1 hypothetical protein LC087_09720 [Bacillus carboniphilus]